MVDKFTFGVWYLDVHGNEVTELQEIPMDDKSHRSKQVKGTRRFRNVGDTKWQ